MSIKCPIINWNIHHCLTKYNRILGLKNFTVAVTLSVDNAINAIGRQLTAPSNFRYQDFLFRELPVMSAGDDGDDEQYFGAHIVVIITPIKCGRF